MSLFSNGAFELYADAFYEQDQKAFVRNQDTLVTADGTEVVPQLRRDHPELKSGCPIVDIMYAISLFDHERIIVDPRMYYYALCAKFGGRRGIPKGVLTDDSVFWAGYGFNTYLYTRDVAYSSWLGTSYVYPDVVRSHLQYLRGLRKNIGYTVSQGHDIPIDGVSCEVLDIDEQELALLYNTNSFTRRTDDVVWVLGMWEYYKATFDESILSWMLDEFDYFDNQFYKWLYDEADGLYRGQATFIDIGGSGYPGYSNQQSIMIKALSTNCLYAAAFEIMAELCHLTGSDDRAEEFISRRRALVEAIRFHLFDGHQFAYFLDPDGKPSDRREILGTAFLVLFNILPEGEQAQVVNAYPGGVYGRPLIWPFYPGESVYHNNSTWPFADVIFSLAEYKCLSKEDVILATLGRMCRHALNGNFNEVLKYETGEFVGCPGYIWSAAAYLGVIFKMIAGMEVDAGGMVRFCPVLPKELGGRFDVSGLRIGDLKLNVHIRGAGQKVVSCSVDDVVVDKPVVRVEEAIRTIEITLDE